MSIALAIIAVAAIVIAVSSVLVYRRVSRFIDDATETLHTVNRLAPKLERFIDEADKELATIRTITTRFAHVSERIEGLTEETVETIVAVLHPIKRLSSTIGLLKAAFFGVIAGAAALRGRRKAADELKKREESAPDRPDVEPLSRN